MPTVLTDIEIKNFLESAPLYAWREYARPPVNRAGLSIREIDSFCEVCKQPRPFQDLSTLGSGSGMASEAFKTGTSILEFKCASCRRARRLFLIEHLVGDSEIKLQKFGELPRKPMPRDPVLQKFFADDLANYEKAVACLANDYGIAAFAYFRRITENNIGRLLDLLRNYSGRLARLMLLIRHGRTSRP